MNKESLSNVMRKYENPVNGERLVLMNVPTVWQPYSAFYLAKEMFPKAQFLIQSRGIDCPLVVDIGTGSGVLAILAKQVWRGAHCVVSDLNPRAVGSAIENWRLNNLPSDEISGVVADGIDEAFISSVWERGGVDVMIANLPQQPLVSVEVLLSRDKEASAWNIDASHDPDGLGIFMSVVSASGRIMKRGGVGLVTASSKQNVVRLERFLNGCVAEGRIVRWEIVSQQRFPVPSTYDPKLIDYWLQRQESDGAQRLFQGQDGQWQYEHYNMILYY